MTVAEPKHYKTRFTPQNAREMSARANAARRAKEEERQRVAALPKEPPIASELLHARKLECLERQMARIDELLEKVKDAKDWNFLTNSKGRLFEAWAHLAGIPRPGSRRPRPEPSTRRQVQPSYDPTPAPAAEPPKQLNPLAGNGYWDY